MPGKLFLKSATGHYLVCTEVIPSTSQSPPLVRQVQGPWLSEEAVSELTVSFWISALTRTLEVVSNLAGVRAIGLPQIHPSAQKALLTLALLPFCLF